jgi:thiamine biosynthesis lipoprotein
MNNESRKMKFKSITQLKGYLNTLYKMISAISITIIFTSFNTYPELERYELSGHAQGTTWHISYYAADSVIAKTSIDNLFNEIDNSLSLYKPNSLITKFNQSERGVKMDTHLKKVVDKSLAINKETHGVFDVTVKPLVQAWGFGVNKTETPPDSITIKSILKYIGSDKIKIKNDSLIKKKNGVEIDLNGIAQGYTVDVIAAFLDKKGVRNYLVEVGGEIRVKGKSVGGKKFRIGIESPDDKGETLIKRILSVDNGAITTSGNYRKYKLYGDKKISHLIDAKSGFPVFNEMISVTVWAKDAMTSDGFDNVFMNLGVKESLRYLKNRSDLAAYFIYHKEDKTIADTSSSGFNKLFNN